MLVTKIILASIGSLMVGLPIGEALDLNVLPQLSLNAGLYLLAIVGVNR